MSVVSKPPFIRYSVTAAQWAKTPPTPQTQWPRTASADLSLTGLWVGRRHQRLGFVRLQLGTDLLHMSPHFVASSYQNMCSWSMAEAWSTSQARQVRSHVCL